MGPGRRSGRGWGPRGWGSGLAGACRGCPAERGARRRVRALPGLVVAGQARPAGLRHRAAGGRTGAALQAPEAPGWSSRGLRPGNAGSGPGLGPRGRRAQDGRPASQEAVSAST